MCPEIPFWFVLLAVIGSMSLVILPLWAMWSFLMKMLEKDEPVTHVGQIKRRIFG